MVYAVGVDVEDVFNFIDCTVDGVSQIEIQTYTVSSVGVGVDFYFVALLPLLWYNQKDAHTHHTFTIVPCLIYSNRKY
jgi:hypothetical protein